MSITRNKNFSVGLEILKKYMNKYNYVLANDGKVYERVDGTKNTWKLFRDGDKFFPLTFIDFYEDQCVNSLSKWFANIAQLFSNNKYNQIALPVSFEDDMKDGHIMEIPFKKMTEKVVELKDGFIDRFLDINTFTTEVSNIGCLLYMPQYDREMIVNGKMIESINDIMKPFTEILENSGLHKDKKFINNLLNMLIENSENF